MNPIPRTQRRRHRRRSHRRTRAVSLIVAAMSLIMGVTLFISGAGERHAFSHAAGYAYLAVAAAAFVVYAAVARFNPLTRLLRAGDDRDSRRGMALLAVLLLMALLAGALLQGMVTVRRHLRLAEWRRDALLLRTAAMDAVLASLRASVNGHALPLAAPTENRLPSGIVTRTVARAADRGALPAALRRDEAPVLGDCFELIADASRAGRSRGARSLVCRAPNGDMRVLAWIEAP